MSYFTIPKNFHQFFSFIDNEEKQKRFNSLVEEKNLTFDDLDLIFQTVRPKQNAVTTHIRRVCSVTTAEVTVVNVNKGKGTEESPLINTNLYWSKDGVFIGETIYC